MLESSVNGDYEEVPSTMFKFINNYDFISIFRKPLPLYGLLSRCQMMFVHPHLKFLVIFI